VLKLSAIAYVPRAYANDVAGTGVDRFSNVRAMSICPEKCHLTSRQIPLPW